MGDRSAPPTRRRRRWGASALVVVAIGAASAVGTSVLWHRALVDADAQLARHEASQADTVHLRARHPGTAAGEGGTSALASDLSVATRFHRGGPQSAQARRSASAGWAAAGPTTETAALTGAPGVVSTWTVPLALLAGGLLLLAALAGLAWSLARSRREAERSALRSHLARERSEARFASIAAASPIGIIETTGSLEVTYLNPRLEAIVERPASEVLGTRWTDLVHPDDRASFMALARESASGQRELSTTLRLLRPSGEVRTVRVTATVGRFDTKAGGVRYVSAVEDVSEEVALHQQLRHQALHDALTGLPNRTLFMDRLGQSIEHSLRGERVPAALVLDVDRFKVVNDSLGHKVGDRLLVQLAERLRTSTRRGETVARLGGDEFAVLLPEASSMADAVVVAERVLRSLDDPFRVQGREMVVSVSIGIVLCKPTDDPDTALRAADAAMYRAKDEGRGTFAIYEDDLHERSLEHLTIETEIRRGIKEGEFEVFFQPVIDLTSDDLVGAEALVRWRHPERGLLPPNVFIPVAEETGLIVPLGQWVWGAALAQLAAFDADPAGPRIGTLAINLSSHQLRNQRLARERQALCVQHGIDPRRICIELTETVAMDDNETTRDTLQSASRAGVQVAIDDFGTGYSSLAYLQALPISTLKVDRRFTAGVGTDGEADAIVAAIIEMAHHLGLSVVAEGVEDEVQRQRLLELGCNTAQGFLWARPLPAAELTDWWAGRRPVPA